MKKHTKFVAFMILLVAVSVLVTGCMGSFVVTKKVYAWNEKATGDKYINNVIFWIFLWLPVYDISVFADVVILNLIEFWTGSNPLAMAPGQKEVKIVKCDGKEFEVTATQNRFDIRELKGTDAGEIVSLVYAPEAKTWNLVNDSKTVTIAKMDGNKMNLLYPDGKVLKVNLTR